jgi:hypothetical protein
MNKIKKLPMPLQVVAWPIIAGLMVISWDLFLAFSISALTSLTFYDIMESTPVWVMNFFLFMGCLVTVGAWLWDSEKN